MKTKDLIKILNELDPSGESQVCILNEDIKYIGMREAYWDGRLEMVTKRSENGWPLKSKITSSGTKIDIVPVDLEDIYIDSILYGQQEYIIDVESERNYWSMWTHKKFRWLDFCENYAKDTRRFETNEILPLIEKIREQYIQEGKKKAIDDVNNHKISKKAQELTIKLIEKIYSFNLPVVFSSIACSLKRNRIDYIWIHAEGLYNYKWRVSRNGNEILLYYGMQNKEGELFDINNYDYSEFVKNLERKYSYPE